MSDWESETHATTTVARTEEGKIRYIKCRAEYFEVKETDDDLEDEYAEGVNAKFKFDVVDGSVAVLDGVKDIADDAPNGYDTSLDFLRAVPVAEEAVSNVPGIKEVHSTSEYIEQELDRGATALL
jgi:hypothetical protein